MRELVKELALSLREQVLPELGSHTGRAHSGAGASGDVTFAIDEAAEQHLEQFIAERAPGIAFYSEDRGLVEPVGTAEHVLIVDPIDGTRPAMAGFESACVSVAAAPLGSGEPRFGDVVAGCIVEIKSGNTFSAERGQGVTADIELAPSTNTDLSKLFWAYGLRGRPARATVEVLSELLDASSVGGGTFDLGSATYDMTRVLTGQLDAYIEPAPRMVEEIAGMRAAFERVGDGHVLNNTPYDLAAAALCLTEGGAIVTDAHGEPLDSRPLLGSDHSYQISCIASSNEALHRQLVEAIDRGIARLAATI